MKPTIYLIGAIRDGRNGDIDWRERVIRAVGPRATVLNPLGGKTYSRSTGQWGITGGIPDAPHIVAHDFWCVDRADIIVANLLALEDGYPNIGSLLELGRSTARPVLRYLILPPYFKGHENPRMFSMHPFLKEVASHSFPTVDALLDFLPTKLEVLSGVNPNFGGVIP